MCRFASLTCWFGGAGAAPDGGKEWAAVMDPWLLAPDKGGAIGGAEGWWTSAMLMSDRVPGVEGLTSVSHLLTLPRPPAAAAAAVVVVAVSAAALSNSPAAALVPACHAWVRERV